MEDLLFRFSNKALGDTCERVGREPERKLSASDRLVGARKLCREEGSGTAFLDLAIGAALHRYLREQSRPQTPEEAAKALKELSGEEIPEAIAFYEAILAGADAGTLRRMAEKQRKAALGAIV
jgi:mannitol-1-phosphate/altronate dehydrogenase